ncbi:Uncharacterised protein [Candidatus Norongarragalina meridionalis]|nr:Uncharacterised protein [Candidatus Norongarragalina meridionalis]
MRLGVIALLLLVPIAAAFSFSEYSYLLKSESPSLASLFLLPRDCSGFSTIEIARNARSDKDFGDAVTLADKANSDLANAAAVAWQQRLSLSWGAAGVLAYRQYSFWCFSYGASALTEASDSAKKGFEALDSKIAEFEQATDENYTGAAGGLFAEFGELKKQIEERDANGESIAQRFVNASERVSFAWNALAWSPSAAPITDAANALVSDDSLLRQQAEYRDRVQDVLDGLNAERDAFATQADAKITAASRALDAVERENLRDVGESAFLLVGAGESLASEYQLASFEDDLNRAQQLLDDANAMKEESPRLERLKAQGWLTRGIISLRTAVAKATEAETISKQADQRSRSLESALRLRVLEEQRLASAAIEKARASNPYAASSASALLSKNYDSLSSSLKTRGERINFYLSEITQLRDVRDAAEKPSFAREKKTELLAKAESVGALLEKVAKDGIDVSALKAQLSQARSAIASAEETESNQQLLLALGDDLRKIEEGAYALETEEFGVLKDEYDAASQDSEFLSRAEQMRLDDYARLFKGGETDVAKNAGSLAQARDDIEAMLSKLDVDTPNILKRHLEAGAETETTYDDVVRLDAPAIATTAITFRNLLSLEYDSLLALEPPVSLENATVVSAGDGVSVQGGKIMLQRVEAGGVYVLTVRDSEVLARKKTEVSETLSANEREAAKRWTVRFDCVRDADVLVEKTFAFDVEAVTGALLEERTARAIVPCLKGANTFAIEYRIPNPVSVEKTFSEKTNVSIELLYVLRNNAEELRNFEYDDVQTLACSAKSVSVVTPMKYKTEFLAGALMLQFKQDSFPAGASYESHVLVECDSLQIAAATKLAELKASGTNDTRVSDAEARIAEGKYGKALELLFAAENAIIAANQTALDKNEAQREIDAALAFNSTAVRAVASQANARLAAAQTDAETKAALKGLHDALKALAQEKISALKCSSCSAETKNATQKARETFAIGDYLSAISLAENAAALQAADERGVEENNALLAALSDKLDDAKKTARATEALFDKAFSASQDREAVRKRFLRYQEGLRSRTALEKAITEAEKALSKSDAEKTAGLIDDVESRRLELEGSIEGMQTEAERELELVQQGDAQFGTTETKAAVALAQGALKDGSFFTAYVTANDARNALLKIPTSNSGNDDSWRILLGAAGLCIIALLAYLFTRKGGKRAKEI